MGFITGHLLNGVFQVLNSRPPLQCAEFVLHYKGRTSLHSLKGHNHGYSIIYLGLSSLLHQFAH